MPSSFSGTYYGPISTTTMFDIAKQFAGSNGRILELYPSFSKRGLRVSWLSNFPDEDEVLYMNASFQIVNIYSNSTQNIYASPLDKNLPFHKDRHFEYYTDSEESISSNSSGPTKIKETKAKKLKEVVPKEYTQSRDPTQTQSILVPNAKFPLPQISEDRFSVKYFEKSIMRAIQMINIDSYIISFNATGLDKEMIEHKLGELRDEEDSKYDNATLESFYESGFSKLKSTEQVTVLYLLYIQYKKHEWTHFVNSTPDYVNMAIAKYRDQFMQLAQNVQAVKMEKASKVIQQFFAKVHEDSYEFPANSRKSREASEIKKVLKIMLNKDNEKYILHLPTFCKLFPNCRQLKVNGDNFDWSLDSIIDFLTKYNLNYSRIALQDIYIRFTDDKGSCDNMEHSEKMAKKKIIREASTKKLEQLKKLGWQFERGTRCHLHRYGFQPHPEVPFLDLVSKQDQEMYYNSYSEALKVKKPHNTWVKGKDRSYSSLPTSHSGTDRTTARFQFLWQKGRRITPSRDRNSSILTAKSSNYSRKSKSRRISHVSNGSRGSNASSRGSRKSSKALEIPQQAMHAQKSSSSDLKGYVSEGQLVHANNLNLSARALELAWSRTSSLNRSHTRLKTPVEGSDIIIVPYNPKVCDLSSNVFYKHDEENRRQIFLLLKWRQSGGKIPIDDENINKKKELFNKLCKKVEQLVLDPMPEALRMVFIEKSQTKLQREIISFESIIKIFPNVKDVFLRETRFSLRVWYALLKSMKRFDEKHNHISKESLSKDNNINMISLSKSISINSMGPGAAKTCKLNRIFFSKQCKFNHKDLKTMDLRFKPHGWKFQPREQVIFKMNQSV